MSESDTLLVRALAVADAARLPIRRWEGALAANRAAVLAVLASSGAPVRVGGHGAARASGRAALADLERGGLIVTAAVTGAKLVSVRLTAAGEHRARALVGLPDRAAGRKFLAAVVRLERQRDPDAGGVRWVPEVLLNRGRGWGDERHAELAALEQDFLPAASAGWVVAHSACTGHAAYALTDAGRAARASTDPDFAPVEFDPAAPALYRGEVDRAIRELTQSDPPTPGEIGPLPLALCDIAIDDEPAPPKPRRKR